MHILFEVLATHKRQTGNAELPVYLAGVLKNVSHSTDNQEFLIREGGQREMSFPEEIQVLKYVF